MIVSHANRFVFLRPMKVASSSICAALRPHLKAGDGATDNSFLPGDEPAGLVDLGGNPHRVGEGIRHGVKRASADYVFFTVCRNPWQQAVSLFQYKTRHEKMDFETAKTRFRTFLLGGRLLPNVAHFTLYGLPIADHYICYEQLNEGMSQLSDVLGLSPGIDMTGHRLKWSSYDFKLRGEAVRDFFDPETWDHVRIAAASEIALMGYADEVSAGSGAALIHRPSSAIRHSLLAA